MANILGKIETLLTEPKPHAEPSSLQRIGEALGIEKQLDKKTVARLRDTQRECDRLWEQVNSHGRDRIKPAFLAQTAAVADAKIDPDETVSREELALKYQNIRTSSKQAAWKLGEQCVADARAVAEVYSTIATSEADKLEASERAIAERFGVDHKPGPAVVALRQAAAAAVAMAGRPNSAAPRARLPWIQW